MSEARKRKSPAKKRSKDAKQRDFDDFVRVCRLELLKSHQWPRERIDRVMIILASRRWGSAGSYERFAQTRNKNLLEHMGLSNDLIAKELLVPGRLVMGPLFDDADFAQLRLSDDPEEQYRLRDQIYVFLEGRVPLTFHMAVWLDGVLSESSRKDFGATDARQSKAVEDFRIGAGMRALRNNGRAPRNSGSHASRFVTDTIDEDDVYRRARRFTTLLDVIEKASEQKLSTPLPKTVVDAIKADPHLSEGLALWNEHLFLMPQPDRVVLGLIEVLREHDLLMASGGPTEASS